MIQKVQTIKSKEEALINAEKFYNNRNNFIKAYKDRVFPFNDALPD